MDFSHIVVLSAVETHREAIDLAARKWRLITISCRTFEEMSFRLRRHTVRAIVLDDTLQDSRLSEIVALADSIPVIVLSRVADWEHYFAAIEAGAFDLIASPPDPSETERVLGLAISESRKARAATVKLAASAAC